MTTFSIVLILFCGCIVNATSHNSSCSGEHEYKDANGLCKQCEKCPAGQQPKPTAYCGYGERSTGYGCEDCPHDTFSPSEGYRICVACIPCSLLNSYTSRECTAVSNRICGTCWKQFFRPLKSDGTRDDECHACSAATHDIKECNDEDHGWRSIAFIIGGVCVILSIIVLVCCLKNRKSFKTCLGWCKSDPQKSQYGNSRQERLYSKNRESTTSSDVFLVNESKGSLIEETGNYCEQINDKPTSLSLKAEVRHSQIDSAFISAMDSHPASNYSQMETAEYQEVLAGGDNYSNMPTKSFQESLKQHRTTTLGAQNIPREGDVPQCGCDHSSLLRLQRKKHRNDQSGSSESLLSSPNLESTDGRRCSFHSVKPGSFDFNSYEEENKHPQI